SRNRPRCRCISGSRRPGRVIAATVLSFVFAFFLPRSAHAIAAECRSPVVSCGPAGPRRCACVREEPAPNRSGDALPADLSAKIDKIANDALAKSGVPSASVAVVRDGKLVYAKAYGD